MLGIWKGKLLENDQFLLFSKEICLGELTPKQVDRLRYDWTIRKGNYFLVFWGGIYTLFAGVETVNDTIRNETIRIGSETEIFGYLSQITGRIYICNKLERMDHDYSLLMTLNNLSATI